jgi:hypothetical protein
VLRDTFDGVVIGSEVATVRRCDVWRMVLASAPALNVSCWAVWSSASSISFEWSPATSSADVTYYLTDGTTVLANTTTTSATVYDLAAGANYSYSLFASTSGSDSTSESVYCTGWTGELL